MDFKTMFLNCDLEESIYMMQPDKFITKGQEHLVCNMHKSIYGLKQAFCSWNRSTYIENIFVKYVMQDSKKGLLPFRHGVPLSQIRGETASWRSSKEPRNHQKGKHIERKYHLIHEIVMRRDMTLEKIAFAKNLVDPFMKTLSTRVFDGHRDSFGIRCVPNML
ncbi:hypothetical protein AAG906_036888 [Vitis piasezkii]